MLEIKDLCAGYRPNVDVLKDVCMVIQPRDFVAILGANGAGKTTLARTISGMLRSRRGVITWEGRRLPPDPQQVTAKGIVHVPEARGIFGDLTVEDNLFLGAYWLRNRKERDERTTRVYDTFPVLKERRTSPAGALSGGQQQMLALGRGLMADPLLLIVDEPSLGLAPNLVDEVLSYLKVLNGEGLSVVLIEQNEIALEYCERVYVLRGGQVVLEDTPEALAGSKQLKKSYL